MATEQFRDFLKMLEEATRLGQVKWHETANQNAFRIAFHRGIVKVEHLSSIYDQGGGTEYVAHLEDSEGRVLDTYGGEDPQSHEFLKKLYGEARSSARDVKETLDSMLKDLMSGKTVVPPDPDNDIPF